jgi:hypothetical protein
MKRFISISVLIFLTLCSVFAQRSKSVTTLTDKQWQVLVSALENEDWNAVAAYSLKYIKQLRYGDKENALPRLRYDFIFACAGKATEGKMSQEQLKAALRGFIGKEVEEPARQITTSFKASSYNNKIYDLLIAPTNHQGTSIFAFEYINLQDKFDFASHQGQWAIVNGTLKSIEINPNVLRLWALRIVIERAHVTLEKQ